MTTCNRFAPNKPPGIYVIRTNVNGSGVILSGSRALGGQTLETWTNDDLFNGSKSIQVGSGENHQIFIDADFQDDTTRVEVTLQFNGADVCPSCSLRESGDDSCAYVLNGA